jgi:hypothetical protein
LLRAAFRGILRDECIEPEIERALRAAKCLDHLFACYWISQDGHHGQKKNAKRGGRAPDSAFRESLFEELGKG